MSIINKSNSISYEIKFENNIIFGWNRIQFKNLSTNKISYLVNNNNNFFKNYIFKFGQIMGINNSISNDFYDYFYQSEGTILINKNC